MSLAAAAPAGAASRAAAIRAVALVLGQGATLEAALAAPAVTALAGAARAFSLPPGVTPDPPHPPKG